MNNNRHFISCLYALIFLLLLSACSSRKFIPKDEYLLNRVYVHCDSSHFSLSDVKGFIKQNPNARWLSSVKVPLGFYIMGGRDSTSRITKMLRRIGEAPVIYDSIITERSRMNIEHAIQNKGYLHATVTVTSKEKGYKKAVYYNVHPGALYHIDKITIDLQDTSLNYGMKNAMEHTLLKEGMPFDANILDSERSRFHNVWANDGYYLFNKDFVHYLADTTAGNNIVHLTMQILPYHKPGSTVLQPHKQFRIGTIEWHNDTIGGNKSYIRDRVLYNSLSLKSGDLYRLDDLNDTYSRLNRFGAVAAVNIKIQESPEDSTLLDAKINLTPAHLNSIKFNLDGTNSAGDFGAACAVTYQNKNVFHGSESYFVKGRFAFENIHGLTGYSDQNYIEYSVETGLTFPDFIFPFLTHNFRRKAQATSELSIMFDSQNRPEFHRRVLTAGWKYRWQRYGGKMQHRFDLLDINYVFMPSISETFRQKYLDNPTSRNAILRYNYEDLFIVCWRYQINYCNIPLTASNSIYGKNAYSIRAAIETGGNLLDGMVSLFGGQKNADGQLTLFNIAFAQYAKFDFDFAKSFRFSSRHSLALHLGFGIAYPYGNSSILPYEKRYFSGGANSVRGWSVRELGPGSFKGTDGQIDFINQTGDMKLDINVEYRAHLFWKLDGAVFVDAGNIWTLRDYPDQPGGQFRFSTFAKQIAMSYGLGIRFNFDYFFLRLDAGMKAINPAYDDDYYHYPIIHPNFKRDFTIHFAVGMPF